MVGAIRAGRTLGPTPPQAPVLQGIERCKELAQRGIDRITVLEPIPNPWVEPNEQLCWKAADNVNASVSTTAGLFSVIRDAAAKVVDGPKAADAKQIVSWCDRAYQADQELASQLPAEKAQRHVFQYCGIVESRKANALGWLTDILKRCG